MKRIFNPLNLKLMNKIGIMQGRVLPKRIDKLQIFPEGWQKELSFIKKTGFDYVELLDDKENQLLNTLKNKKNEIFKEIYKNKLRCQSICMDRLCNYSLIQKPNLFFKKLEELINSLKKKGGVRLIIPFFDKNKLINKKQLRSALKALSGYSQFLIKNNLYFSLEINLPAEVINNEFQKFQFKNIGICYDLGNNIDRDVNLYDEITLLKNRINHIHIKDKKERKNIRIRKNLRQLSLAFQALKKISFNGLMVLETCISPDPLEEAKKNLATVRKYLNEVN